MNRYSVSFRAIAFFIAITLFFQNQSFAQSTSLSISPAAGAADKFHAWSAPNSPASSLLKSPPDVWIIEDAHTSLNAQLQIARILETLHAFEPRSVVGLEGHSGALAIDFLRLFPDAQIRSMAAYKLLRESKISAVEYAAITHSQNRDMHVFGIENNRLYTSNWNAYRQLQRETLSHSAVFNKISVLISRLEKDILSRPLQRWMKALHHMDNAEIDASWADDLRSAVKKLHATGIESRRLQLLLEEKISLASVSSEEWLSEINRAFEEMIELEARSTLELKTVRLIRALRQFQRILELKAARQDYLAFQSVQSNVVESLLKAAADLSRTQAYGLFSEKDKAKLSEHFERARLFYRVALMREKAMAQNLRQEMRRQKMKTGVVVTGGLHTQGLLQAFQKMGLSAIVLRPQIKSIDTDRAYQERALSKDSAADTRAELTELVYAMFGAAILEGHDLETLKKEYLDKLTSPTKTKRIVSVSKLNKPLSRTKQRKLHRRSVSAVNSPSSLRFAPRIPSAQQLSIMSLSRSRVTFQTPAGIWAGTESSDGSFVFAPTRSEVRIPKPGFSILKTFLLAALLAVSFSSCTSLSKNKGPAKWNEPVPRAQTVEAADDARRAAKPFALPKLPKVNDDSRISSFDSSIVADLPSSTEKAGSIAEDSFLLLPPLSEVGAPTLEETARASLTGTEPISESPKSVSLGANYEKSSRLQIMSPMTKTDSCPLCNAMTASEMQKLKAAGVVAEMNPYTVEFKDAADAIRTLRDQKQDWVQRYKAIMYLTVHRDKTGLAAAHQLIQSTSVSGAYNFDDGVEGVRILRALAPQWLVMIGPNQADLQLMIQFGLNDPDNLVRYMSMHALGEAAKADPESKIFSKKLKQEAASRIAQSAEEDPDLFARYEAFIALPKIAGKDKAAATIRYGLENEKDFYALKAAVMSAMDYPTETFTEGLLEILKRQPPEKEPELIREYGELKQMVRQAFAKLYANETFQEGALNALMRKFALNDMYSVTVGIKNSQHQFIQLLIEVML